MKRTTISNPEEFDAITDSDAEGVSWVESVDWKAEPETTLEAVDSLLNSMGYQIELFDAGDDQVAFRIIQGTGE